MSQRTYTRRYLAEILQAYTLTDDDLTLSERDVLEQSSASPEDADEILTRFDADHEEFSALEDRQLVITRTR